MRIGVIIVAFNAETTLVEVINRIPKTFASGLIAICICDDASRDDTFEVAMQCQKSHPELPIHIRRNASNRGYGGNQKTGYSWAQELQLDAVVLLHADAQYAPEVLPDIIKPITDGQADAVFGSRMMERGAALQGGMPKYKYFGNIVLTRWQNYFADTQFSEWHSGYRAYSMKSLNNIAFQSNSNDFNFDTQIILQLLDSGARIHEIAIPTYYGDEISHVNGMKYGLQVMYETARYRLSKIGFGTTRYSHQIHRYNLKSAVNSSHALIDQFFLGKPKFRVLDLGCGDGTLGARAENLGHEVVGVDISPTNSFPQKLKCYVQADLNVGIPEGIRGPFDIVLCADILEHLYKPEVLLHECRNVLSPNGRIIVSVPNFAHWYPRMRILLGLFDYDAKGILDRTHLRFFTKRSFQRFAKINGYLHNKPRCTGIPFDQIFHSNNKHMLRIVNLLIKFEQLFIWLRPQLFAYQFVFELTPDKPNAN